MLASAIKPFGLAITAFLLVLGMAATTVSVTAQGMDATPAAEGDVTQSAAFPAHIHSGTCAELGDVVYPLSDLLRTGGAVPPDATPVEGIPTAEPADNATPSMTEGGEGEATVFAGSTTIVEASLDDILAEEHAINVHLSEEEIGTYIACGDLTGEPTDGELDIDLQELNESGYTGHAQLLDNGDGTTTVTVELLAVEVDATGTPEATPAS